MSSLDDALGQLRRSQRETWAEAAGRGYATPDTDDQLRGIWDARELLDAAACSLAILRAARPHDPELADSERQLVSAHHHMYRVECARHRELGSVAPGERTRHAVPVDAAAEERA
jgi:hypothetical protein